MNDATSTARAAGPGAAGHLLGPGAAGIAEPETLARLMAASDEELALAVAAFVAHHLLAAGRSEDGSRDDRADRRDRR